MDRIKELASDCPYLNVTSSSNNMLHKRYFETADILSMSSFSMTCRFNNVSNGIGTAVTFLTTGGSYDMLYGTLPTSGGTPGIFPVSSIIFILSDTPPTKTSDVVAVYKIDPTSVKQTPMS